MLDLIHVRLDAGGHGRQAAALFVALAERRGHALSALSVDLGLDPLGAMAAMGRLSASWDEVAARMAETRADLAARGFGGRIFLSDGRPYQEAGASEAQELAAVLATGIATLRALEAGGVPLDAARDTLAFLLVADADEFLTVAKFRALRHLWARVEQACGLQPKPIRLHAETAWRMTTRRDPWVNMLRTTVATFSAGLGGADSITVLPFTAALGLPDAFARRVARNTHLILIEEANLARVADPASGAGGFEALTEALCEKAWGLFQAIERDGGIVENLKRGALQREIAEVRAAARQGRGDAPGPDHRNERVSEPCRRRRHGADALAFVGRRRRARRTIPAPAIRHCTDDLFRTGCQGLERRCIRRTDPLGGGRLSACHRAPALDPHCGTLRAPARSTPTRLWRGRESDPRIFLATLGSPAAYTARAGFAKNFFEAGGIEAVMPEGTSNVDALTTAFRESDAVMICLCSSDALYAKDGIDALAALRPLTAGPIYVAGRPAELAEGLAQAGATGFIHAGCDAVAVLNEALAAVGA